jgi:hypothetical protein
MIALCKKNVTNILGLSCFQKVIDAFRMLTYGVPADLTDEYVRIGEITALERLHKFVVVVVDIFSDEYLRYPNEANTSRLLALREKKWLSWKFMVYRLYALVVEELSSSKTTFGSGMPSWNVWVS